MPSRSGRGRTTSSDKTRRGSGSHRHGTGRQRALKANTTQKMRIVWKLVLGGLNLALVTVAALMIAYSSKSHSLVLNFTSSGSGSGSTAGNASVAMNATAAEAVMTANLTDNWDDLAEEVAATVLITGMYTLLLALVGLCAVTEGREAMLVFYLCYLIVSAVVLVYATAYAFVFQDTLQDTISVYAKAVETMSETLMNDTSFAFVNENATDTGAAAFAVLSNCAIVGLIVVLVEIVICVVLLGCTKAVASLVMIFNFVTGATGVVFVLLSIFIYSWSYGNEWASAILTVSGTLCAALSFFGFKVAEVVLGFVRATNEQLSKEQGRSGGVSGGGGGGGGGGARGKKEIIKRTDYAKYPKVCAFGYLGAVGAVIVLLLVNSIFAFNSVDDVAELANKTSNTLEYISFGYKPPQAELEMLLTQYFTLIAIGGLLLMQVTVFNFVGSAYLFVVAFRVSRDIRIRNRSVEFQSLLYNENGSSSDDDDHNNNHHHSAHHDHDHDHDRWSESASLDSKNSSSTDDDSGTGSTGRRKPRRRRREASAALRASTYAISVGADPALAALSDTLESVTQFLRLGKPEEAADTIRALRRERSIGLDSKMREYLQILGLKISARWERFRKDPGNAEQNLMDAINRHFLRLQRPTATRETVDFGAWKRTLLEVGDPDAAAQRLAAESSGRGSLSARSNASTLRGEDDTGSSEGEDYTDGEVEIVLGSDATDSDASN